MKSNIKLKVYLEYDPEYQGFVADIPTLPGCMSQGKTEKEALENIKEAAAGYLKTIKKHKKIIPSEIVRYVTIGA
jgi:predicted RNase H-like HicB family nuclease